MFLFPKETIAEVRKRLSRGSFDVQTGQPQPITGTPWEVPVPRNVNLNFGMGILFFIEKANLVFLFLKQIFSYFYTSKLKNHQPNFS
jgi:hypothetical protein